MAQDYVIEVKQIEIPGYPLAFNPSIVRWRGNLVMSFRTIPDLKHKFNGRLGLVCLDDDFNIIGQPQLLDTAMVNSTIPARTDDGRLIVIEDRLWMVYSDCRDPIISKGGFRVYIGEVVHNDGIFSIQQIECISQFEGQNSNVREKNWVPFDYCDKMYLAYSLAPHKIFYPLIGRGSCATFTSTLGDIDWQKNWGEVRGGTTALLDGDHYLSFFHSWIKMKTFQSNGKTISHYFMGAYTFSKDPPFEITNISPEPIVGKGFYSGNVYKPLFGTVAVMYPLGLIFDDKYIWLSCGKHDHECWIIKLDKEKVLESLIPVYTLKVN